MFDPAVIAMSIPILALMIPIVAIFTQHQRKMAELIHSKNSVAPAELDAIRQDLRELRSLLNNQTIAIDDLRSRGINSAGDPSIQNRLEVS